jgi:hypothetical protein
MNELFSNTMLRIQLTATPLNWAKAGVSVLSQMPCVELLEANSSIDDMCVDVVLHFGNYSDAMNRQ